MAVLLPTAQRGVHIHTHRKGYELQLSEPVSDDEKENASVPRSHTHTHQGQAPCDKLLAYWNGTTEQTTTCHEVTT